MVIKTAKLEHKNYKQELNRMLRNYRATPYSKTTVMFRRKHHRFGTLVETNLPEVMTPCSDALNRQPNQTANAKMKEHADNKRYVKPSTITEGDVVLVKKDETKKKSDTPYYPKPRTVVKTKGAMVTEEIMMASRLQGTLLSSKACP